MGGKSSPVAQIVKAVKDVGDTGAKIVGDGVKVATDVINSGVSTGKKAIEDTSRQVGRLDKIILSPTNAKEEAGKDAAKRDAEQRAAAVRDQEQASSDLRKQNASNADATRGSSIILGRSKKKGKKGGSVSSGMGLSKGKTGLQT